MSSRSGTQLARRRAIRARGETRSHLIAVLGGVPHWAHAHWTPGLGIEVGEGLAGLGVEGD